MNKIIEDYINSLIEEDENRRLRKFVDDITPIVLNAKKNSEISQPRTLYYENSYKQPSIYTSPNMAEIRKSPDRLFADKIMPAIQNTIRTTEDAVKGGIDTITNQKIDYSKPMLPHEKVTDTLIKTIGKVLYPTSSDMYTDGMTNFAKAKQNPNAEIINIEQISDNELKTKLQNYGVKQNEQGVLYNNDSEMSKRLSNSPEIKKIKNENYNDIKKGIKTDFPVKFEAKWYDTFLNPEKFERHSSIQNGILTNARIDDKGNLTGKLYDREDFLQRKVKNLLDFSSIFNNHGYNMQEKGNFQNYFTVTDINQKEKNNYNDELRKIIELFIKLLK
ncbi:hypothetical protein IJ750_01460 [bacterium]|nr:hypothetical protein [bacterium]